MKSGITSLLKESEEKPVYYITSGEILAMVLRDYKELYEVIRPVPANAIVAGIPSRILRYKDESK